MKHLLSGLFQLLFLKSGAMLRWQCSHTFIVPDNIGKMEYKVFNIEICVSVSDCLSFYFTALLIMLRLQPIDLDFKVLNSVQTRQRCQEQDL